MAFYDEKRAAIERNRPYVPKFGFGIRMEASPQQIKEFKEAMNSFKAASVAAPFVAKVFHNMLEASGVSIPLEVLFKTLAAETMGASADGVSGMLQLVQSETVQYGVQVLATAFGDIINKAGTAATTLDTFLTSLGNLTSSLEESKTSVDTLTQSMDPNKDVFDQVFAWWTNFLNLLTGVSRGGGQDGGAGVPYGGVWSPSMGGNVAPPIINYGNAGAMDVSEYLGGLGYGW